MTLEEMLEKINFQYLEKIYAGNGWIGTRYVLHTYNDGQSHPCETLEELKEWIKNKFRL